MNTPFENDPFSIAWLAFRELYPDKQCVCFFDPEMEDEKGQEVCGLTETVAGRKFAVVAISSKLSIEAATETLAHELAHVAVGIEHKHDEEWEAAFDAIHRKYNEIGDAMYQKYGEKEEQPCEN